MPVEASYKNITGSSSSSTRLHSFLRIVRMALKVQRAACVYMINLRTCKYIRVCIRMVGMGTIFKSHDASDCQEDVLYHAVEVP